MWLKAYPIWYLKLVNRKLIQTQNNLTRILSSRYYPNYTERNRHPEPRPTPKIRDSESQTQTEPNDIVFAFIHLLLELMLLICYRIREANFGLIILSWVIFLRPIFFSTGMIDMFTFYSIYWFDLMEGNFWIEK